jgi:hypothetical protein
MPAHPPRGARYAAPLALVLAAAAAVTACSGGSSTTTAATTTPTSTASRSSDPRAAQVLSRAERQLAADRSYRFSATETVAAASASTTRVAGSVVRGRGVSYTLTVGRTTTQVVRLRGATYVRSVPGRWARLHKPRPVADPTGSLAAILGGLQGAAVATAQAGPGTAVTTVAGELSAAAAKTAGVPTDGKPAQVTVTVDSRYRVTNVTVHTSTQAGSTAVAVTLVTSYSDFDRVPALRRPR